MALLEASMRDSANGLLFRLLLAAGLVILVLTLVQGAWLGLISHLLKANQSAGLPQFSATPLSGLTFPTPRAPGRVGEEVTVGKLAIRVTGVTRAANARVSGASTYQALGAGEEYLLVDISVRCLSANESCRLTEFDFGVRSASGRETPAEFASRSTGLQLFEGGAIASGHSMSGSLIFIIRQADRGLVLYYPRGLSFGGSAEVVLGR
jgi:uncharacterized protein DUF4352